MTVFRLMQKYDLNITRNLVENIWHVSQSVLSKDKMVNLLPIDICASDKSILRAIRIVIRQIKENEKGLG